MADKIQIKRSSEEGKKPTPEQLADGELALNLKDKKIYAKDSDGVVQEFPAVEAVDVGVQKVNDLTGEITIKGSDNIDVDTSGQNITLNTTSNVALKSDLPDALNLTEGDGISITGDYPDLTITNEVTKIDDLSDVDTTETLPQIGAVLVYDGTNWVPGAGGGSSDVENLPDLGDVEFPSDPTTGQILQYTDGKWKNVDVTAADGRTTVNGLGGPVTLTPSGSVSITQPDPNNDNEIVISASSGIPDANSDGNIYGRKNAGWVKIEDTGGGADTLSELTDTDIGTRTADQFLRWDGDDGTGKWKNKTVDLAPSDAQKNVQSDWDAVDGDAFIKNKPPLAPSDAEKNVQSDWNETEATKDEFILNKPTKLSDFQDDLGYTDTDTGIVKLTHGGSSVTGGEAREVTFKSSDASVLFELKDNNEIDFTVPLAGLNIKGVVEYAQPQTQADGKITVNGTEYEVLWDPVTYLDEAQSGVAGAALGDLWIVQYQGDANDEGTVADGNGYVYSLNESGVAEWSLVGPIQGPPGQDGSSFLPISSTDDKVTLSDDGNGTFQIKTGDPNVVRVEVDSVGTTTFDGDVLAEKIIGSGEPDSDVNLILKTQAYVYAKSSTPLVVESATGEDASLINFKNGFGYSYFAGIGTTRDFEIAADTTSATFARFRLGTDCTLTAGDGTAWDCPSDDSIMTRRATEAFVKGGTGDKTGGYLPLAGGVMDIGADVMIPSGRTVAGRLQVGGDQVSGYPTGINILAKGAGNPGDANNNVQIAAWAYEGGSAVVKLCTGSKTAIEHFWNLKHEMVAPNDDPDGAKAIDSLRFVGTGDVDYFSFTEDTRDNSRYIQCNFDAHFGSKIFCSQIQSKDGTDEPSLFFDSSGSAILRTHSTKASYTQLNSGYHIFQSDGSQSRFTDDGDFLIGTTTPYVGDDVIPGSKTVILATAGESIARWVGQAEVDGSTRTCNLFLDCDAVDSEVQFYANNQITVRKEDGSEYTPTKDESIATKKYVDENGGGSGGFPIESEPNGLVLIEANDVDGTTTSWVSCQLTDNDPDKSVADNGVYTWYVNAKPPFDPPYGSPGAPALVLTQQGVLETGCATLRNGRDDWTGAVTGFGLEGIRNSVFYPHVQRAHDSRGPNTDLEWDEVNYHFMRERNPLDTQGFNPCEVGHDRTSQGCYWESSLLTIREGGLGAGVHITAAADYEPTLDYDLVTKKYFDDNRVPLPNPDVPIPPVGSGAGYTWEELERVPGLYLSGVYGINGVYTIIGIEDFQSTPAEASGAQPLILKSYWSTDGRTWTEGFVGGNWSAPASGSTVYWQPTPNNAFGHFCDGPNVIYTGHAFTSTGKTWQGFAVDGSGQTQERFISDYVPIYWDSGIKLDQQPNSENEVPGTTWPEGPCWLTQRQYVIEDLEDDDTDNLIYVQQAAPLTRTDVRLNADRDVICPKVFFEYNGNPDYYRSSNFVYKPLQSEAAIKAANKTDNIGLYFQQGATAIPHKDASATPDGKVVLSLGADDNQFYWWVHKRTTLTTPPGLWQETGLCCAYDRSRNLFAAATADTVRVYEAPYETGTYAYGGRLVASYNVPNALEWTHLSISGGVYILMSKSGSIARLDTNNPANDTFEMIGAGSPPVFTSNPVLAGTNGRFLITGGTDINGMPDFGTGIQGSLQRADWPAAGVIPENQPYAWSGGENDPGSGTTTGDVELTEPVDTGDDKRSTRKLLTTQKDANEYFAEEIAKRAVVVTLTQAEYNALSPPDENTLYLIT